MWGCEEEGIRNQAVDAILIHPQAAKSKCALDIGNKREHQKVNEKDKHRNELVRSVRKYVISVINCDNLSYNTRVD